jgi:hypothetical protein
MVGCGDEGIVRLGGNVQPRPPLPDGGADVGAEDAMRRIYIAWLLLRLRDFRGSSFPFLQNRNS